MKPAAEMSADEHRAEAANLIDRARWPGTPVATVTAWATLALAHLAYANDLDRQREAR